MRRRGDRHRADRGARRAPASRALTRGGGVRAARVPQELRLPRAGTKSQLGPRGPHMRPLRGPCGRGRDLSNSPGITPHAALPRERKAPAPPRRVARRRVDRDAVRGAVLAGRAGAAGGRDGVPSLRRLRGDRAAGRRRRRLLPRDFWLRGAPQARGQGRAGKRARARARGRDVRDHRAVRALRARAGCGGLVRGAVVCAGARAPPRRPSCARSARASSSTARASAP